MLTCREQSLTSFSLSLSLPRSLARSLALPAAAILECWMWRGEAGTGDERRRGGDRQDRKKKTVTVTTPSSTTKITDYLPTVYGFSCR